VLRETCLLLTKKNNKKYYTEFLSILFEALKGKIDKLKKEQNYKNISIAINYLMFILSLSINLRDYPSFIKILLKKYFKLIINLIKEIKNEKICNILLDLLNGLFNEEYKLIYFRENRDKELEELYVVKVIEISKVYVNTIILYKPEIYKNYFHCYLILI
jgi:hypothetical protein